MRGAPGRSGQTPPLDYDNLASSYNERYRGGMPAGIDGLLAKLATDSPPGAWLHAGCGTGAWLRPLAVSGPLIGLDRSQQMLGIAALAAPAAELVQADIARPPLADDSFAVIVCINAVHHFPDARDFVRQCHRMLRPSGRLLIVGFDPFDEDLAWPVYDYFSGVRQRDYSRYPPFPQLEQWLIQNGFRVLGSGVAQRIEQRQTGEQLLQDPFLTAHGTSQLALLSDEAYARGINRIRAEIARSPGIQFTTRLRMKYRLAQRAEAAGNRG